MSFRKRIAAIRFICAAYALLFAACGNSSNDDDNNDDSPGASDDDQVADDDSVDDDDTLADDDSSQTGDDDNDTSPAGDDDDASPTIDDDDESPTTDDDDDDNDNDENVWGGLYVAEGYTSTNYKGWTYYNGVGTTFFDPEDAAGWSQPVEESEDCARYFTDYPTTFDYYYYNGGNVTLTGASVSPIHLTPTSYEYGYYYTADYDPAAVADLFDHGDALSFHTAGNGSIPSFSGESTGTQMIEVTQPADFATLNSLPSGAMTFAWTAGSASGVTVTVSTMNDDYQTMTIVCTAEDADGELTIPQSLMQDLYNNPYSLTVSVSRFRLAQASSGGKDFNFTINTTRSRSVIETAD